MTMLTTTLANDRQNSLEDMWNESIESPKAKYTFKKTNRGEIPRNMWTQFEYGMGEGLLKVDRSGFESDCLSEGTDIFKAWTRMFYKWAL